MADTAGLTPGDIARARALAERARREAEGDSVIAPDSLPRPSVVAADFNLTGDSIEVLSPNQLLDVVTAIGAARADAMSPDTVPGEDLPDIVANDWMEGESIVARFKSVAPGEDSLAAGRDTTAGRVRLESVTATTNARSLYRVLTTDTAREESDTVTTESDTAMVEPDTAMSDTVTAESEVALPATDVAGAESGDTGAESGDTGAEAGTPPVEPGPDQGDPDAPPAQAGTDPGETDVSPAAGDTLLGEEVRPPALHYVRGNQITIHMEGRKVVRMEVQGQTVGFHFEPLPPDSLSAAEDSAAAALDTVVTPPDTANAAEDTIVIPPDHDPPPPRHLARPNRPPRDPGAARGAPVSGAGSTLSSTADPRGQSGEPGRHHTGSPGQPPPAFRGRRRQRGRGRSRRRGHASARRRRSPTTPHRGAQRQGTDQDLQEAAGRLRGRHTGPAGGNRRASGAQRRPARPPPSTCWSG